MKGEQNWSSFLRGLDARTAELFLAAWDQIDTRVPEAPLPAVMGGDDEGRVLRLLWDDDRTRLDLDVLHSGWFHWFYRNRVGGEIEGSEEPVQTVPDRFFELLARF